MKKLTAFTILELIVALVLSSLAMALMFQGAQLFEKLFWRHSHLEQSAMNVNILDKNITTDFYKSETITLKDGALDLTFFNGEKVNYSFLENLMVRNTLLRSDTFHYENSHELEFQNNRVQKLRLFLSLKEDVVRLEYSKTYSPYVKFKELTRFEN